MGQLILQRMRQFQLHALHGQPRCNLASYTAVSTHWGVRFVGAFIRRALLFVVFTGAPHFWKFHAIARVLDITGNPKPNYRPGPALPWPCPIHHACPDSMRTTRIKASVAGLCRRGPAYLLSALKFKISYSSHQTTLH